MTPGLLLVLGCVAGDLAAGHTVISSTGGDAASVTANTRLREGTAWDAPGTVELRRGNHLTVDLGDEATIHGLVIQADNDDDYVVEASSDAVTWRPIWTASGVAGIGLRTRYHVLDEAVQARQLRVYARGGDGFYSIAHLGAFCQVPSDWPAEPSRYSPVAWWERLDNDSMLVVKGGLAAAGALLLLATAILSWRKRERILRRTRDALLAALGLVSFCAWFNFFHFHFDDFVHVWDIYHYYVGAKYFPELGYTRLYECTTVAEAQLFGASAVTGRRITNLTTNELEPAAPAVADPERCTSHFSPERWHDFREDIRFFRGQFSPSRWSNEVLHDHGYNATPVWGILGRGLASLGPASSDQLRDLALIDPILLGAMWLLVAWAFGWRVACVGLLFWGTNYPARYWWNGGAFLRMDWLAFMVAGICLVKKERPGLGGFALGYSALLRIFPGFILVGLFLKVVVGWIRERKIRLTPPIRRFAIGVGLAVVVLLPVSLILAPGRGGVGSLVEFVENSRKHLETPLTNNMGWKTIVSYQKETRVRVEVSASQTDPFGPWKEARRKVFVARLPFFIAGVLGFLALLAWAAADQPDWVALTLGVGLIPFAAELTCYYYSFFLAFAFLWAKRPLVGIGLLGVSAASCFIPRLVTWDDARYFDISVQLVIFVVAATLLVRLSGTRDTPR